MGAAEKPIEGTGYIFVNGRLFAPSFQAGQLIPYDESGENNRNGRRHL